MTKIHLNHQAESPYNYLKERKLRSCFNSCRQHMEGYKDACPEKLEEFRIQVKLQNTRLMEVLENQFKDHVMVG